MRFERVDEGQVDLAKKYLTAMFENTQTSYDCGDASRKIRRAASKKSGFLGSVWKNEFVPNLKKAFTDIKNLHDNNPGSKEHSAESEWFKLVINQAACYLLKSSKNVAERYNYLVDCYEQWSHFKTSLISEVGAALEDMFDYLDDNNDGCCSCWAGLFSSNPDERVRLINPGDGYTCS